MTTTAQLSAACISSGLPQPHPQFLTQILSNTQRLPPLPALLATTKHRLLAADFRAPNILSSTAPTLPSAASNPKLSNLVLSEDIPVQVIDILDIGRSKWEQVELLEAERKGEMTKGREIIRVIPDLENEPSSAATQNQSSSNNARVSRGPFKLWVQDHKGTAIEAFEWKSIEKVVGMSIGAKIMLKKGCKIAHGIVLLEEERCVVLGGKIEAWDKTWREGREERLRKEVEAERSSVSMEEDGEGG